MLFNRFNKSGHMLTTDCMMTDSKNQSYFSKAFKKAALMTSIIIASSYAYKFAHDLYALLQ